MMSPSHVAVVTGANKGIGLAIAHKLALEYPSSSFNNGPLLIYLTARNKERGEEALKNILNDAQLEKAKALVAHGGLADIKYHSLDISEPASIQKFVTFIKHEHPDGIDSLINNAGIAMDGFNINVVDKTLQTNYYGTLSLCQALLPLIRAGGRLVNVSSMAGHLNRYSPAIQSRFRSATSVQQIDALMEAFRSAVAAGSERASGWPSVAYAVSKAGLTGVTRVLALEEEKGGSSDAKILINSCCPGYVNTDMSKGNGVKTPEQGARTPVLLALGDIKGVTGEFWKDEKVTEW